MVNDEHRSVADGLMKEGAVTYFLPLGIGKVKLLSMRRTLVSRVSDGILDGCLLVRSSQVVGPLL